MPIVTKDKIGGSGMASEKKTAGRLGGRLVPMSGAGYEKGDIDLDLFRVEAKSTVGSAVPLKYDFVVKITKESRAVGKEPALAVTYTTENGSPREYGRWVVVREDWFLERVDELRTRAEEE